MRLIAADCLACGHLVWPDQAIFLFSLTRNRNVGPFHRRCADDLTEEDEDRIWEYLDSAPDAPLYRGEEPGWEASGSEEGVDW